MVLLVDDERTPEVIYEEPAYREAQVVLGGRKIAEVAERPEEAKATLKSGRVSLLLLDHDMGKENMSGKNLVDWMRDEGIAPQEVYLITANPIGQGNMAATLIIDMGYRQQTPRYFIRG